MKIINPSLISGHIQDLVETAKESIIIVTPYYEITDWKRVIQTITKAQTRGINITWFSRENAKQKYPNELWDLFKIEPILIKDLHAKIYMNEKRAVVASMNLCKASSDRSTDIGLLTETEKEYNDVKDFYEMYIKNWEIEKPKAIPPEVINVETLHSINAPTRVSNLEYINSIYAFLLKKFEKVEVNINKGSKFDANQIENVLLKASDYSLELTPYKTAIKVFIHLPKYSKIRETDFNNFKASNHGLSCEELSFVESIKMIKYFYKSNFEIKNWDRIRRDFFVSELNILLDFAGKH